MKYIAKIVLSVALVLSMLAFSQETQVNANTEDSPQSGYNLFSSEETITLLNKPNGTVKAKLETYGEYKGQRAEAEIIVKKFLKDNYWVEVTVIDIEGNKYSGYLRNKYVRPNYNSYDFVFVNNLSGLNLRAKANSKSKKLATIPHGTRLDIDPYQDDRESSWVKVSYVKKGKKYTGYVSKKYVKSS